DLRVTPIDALLRAILDVHRAEDGLEVAVEPDADRGWRFGQRMADARLRMIGKRMAPSRCRRAQEQRRQRRDEERGRQTARHQGCVGPSTPSNGVQVKTSGQMSSR